MKTFHILGLPRTGTTIFYDAITRHKKLAYFIPKKLERFAWLRRPRPLEGYIWKELHHELEYKTKTNDIERERVLHEFEKYCKMFHTSYFISKNPDNVLKIRWLEDIQKSKYIVLHRNRDASIRSIYHYAEKNLDRDLNHSISYPKGFQGWVTILGKFGDGSLTYDAITKYHDYLKFYQMSDVEGLDYIEVEYEQFVSDPNTELNKCYEFLGLDKKKIKIPRKIENMNQKYVT